MRDLESIYRSSSRDVGSTSAHLITASQRADQGAWEQLVEVYSPMVYAWGRGRGLPQEDAKDIVQNVLRIVFCKLERFDIDGRDGTFRGWLRTITNHQLIDYHRRLAREISVLNTPEVVQRRVQLERGLDGRHEIVLDESAGPHTVTFAQIRIRQAMEQVRSSVTASTWRAFWGMTFEHATSSQLAAELKISPAAVRLAKARVLQRLRSELARSQ